MFELLIGAAVATGCRCRLVALGLSRAFKRAGFRNTWKVPVLFCPAHWGLCGHLISVLQKRAAGGDHYGHRDRELQTASTKEMRALKSTRLCCCVSGVFILPGCGSESKAHKQNLDWRAAVFVAVWCLARPATAIILAYRVRHSVFVEKAAACPDRSTRRWCGGLWRRVCLAKAF